LCLARLGNRNQICNRNRKTTHL